MGGAQARALTDETFQFRFGMPRVQTVEATGTVVVKMPDATEGKTGGPHFLVVNPAAVSFTLKDDQDNTLATLAQDKVAVISLTDNSTAAGEWFVRVTDVVGAVPPAYGFDDAIIDAYSDNLESVWLFEDAAGDLTDSKNGRDLYDTGAPGDPFDYRKTGKQNYGVGTTGSDRPTAYNEDVAWVPSPDYTFTWNGWVNNPSESTHAVRFFALYEPANFRYIFFDYLWDFPSTTRLIRVSSRDHLGNTIFGKELFPQIALGWHMVTIRQNGQNPLEVILDGATGSPAFLPAPHVGYLYTDFELARFGIGAQDPKTRISAFFTGDCAIDEYSFWRSAYLSNTAIERLWNSGLGRFHSGTPVP